MKKIVLFSLMIAATFQDLKIFKSTYNAAGLFLLTDDELKIPPGTTKNKESFRCGDTKETIQYKDKIHKLVEYFFEAIIRAEKTPTDDRVSYKLIVFEFQEIKNAGEFLNSLIGGTNIDNQVGDFEIDIDETRAKDKYREYSDISESFRESDEELPTMNLLKYAEKSKNIVRKNLLKFVYYFEQLRFNCHHGHRYKCTKIYALHALASIFCFLIPRGGYAQLINSFTFERVQDSYFSITGNENFGYSFGFKGGLTVRMEYAEPGQTSQNIYFTNVHLSARNIEQRRFQFMTIFKNNFIDLNANNLRFKSQELNSIPAVYFFSGDFNARQQENFISSDPSRKAIKGKTKVHELMQSCYLTENLKLPSFPGTTSKINGSTISTIMRISK